MMARIDPNLQEESLKKTGCREIDFTEKPMRGFVFVEPEGIDMDEDLEYWVQLCLDYNPHEKSSKQN